MNFIMEMFPSDMASFSASELDDRGHELNSKIIILINHWPSSQKKESKKMC